MKKGITINDFAKFNGCTLKTVLYYHKARLLPEARRLDNGYRVYGSEEMERMLRIRHLRNLGMDIPHIREVLGNTEGKPMQAVLLELRADLVSEIEDIEERIARIDELLENGPVVTADDFATEIPGLKAVLVQGAKMKSQVDSLLDCMTEHIVPPALQRFNALFEQFVGE